MSDDKSRGDKASDIAKSIWLAGLGAYGKAFNEARDKLDGAGLEPPKLFRDLVEKGMRLEDDVRDSLSSIRKTGASTVEERINRVRESFPLSRTDDIDALNAKLDALVSRVDALAAVVEKTARERQPAKKKAPAAKKKAPAAKRKAPAATKKAPAARKKAPAKKKAAATTRKPPVAKRPSASSRSRKSATTKSKKSRQR
ncbi:MAG: phasin family protein [Pseudomonadota bacterium]